MIEASSYQLKYSKIFSSKYAIILNITSDHIERHKSLKNYINAKFKLLDSQNEKCIALVKKDDEHINKKINSKKFKCKIIKVDTKKNDKNFKNIKNDYFFSETNKENLLFVIEISKKLKLKNRVLFRSIKNFKGLKFRQQIIFKKKNLTIINDSKSTSFSSTTGILREKSNIFWLVGGLNKKGDRLNLKKKDFNNVKAFVFGKNNKFFNQQLRSKIKFENFSNLDAALKGIFELIKKDKLIHNTILFSPCAASFDSFKNFEDRGSYFNRLIKKYLDGI